MFIFTGPRLMWPSSLRLKRTQTLQVFQSISLSLSHTHTHTLMASSTFFTLNTSLAKTHPDNLLILCFPARRHAVILWTLCESVSFSSCLSGLFTRRRLFLFSTQSRTPFICLVINAAEVYFFVALPTSFKLSSVNKSLAHTAEWQKTLFLLSKSFRSVCKHKECFLIS